MNNTSSKSTYASPQVRIIQLKMKHRILCVSGHETQQNNSFGLVDDSREGGRFSVTRKRK